MSKVYQINEIEDKLQPIFAGSPVYRAVLFGSCAKDLADDKSDLDIVLDSRGELRGTRFYGVLEDVVTALDSAPIMMLRPVPSEHMHPPNKLTKKNRLYFIMKRRSFSLQGQPFNFF